MKKMFSITRSALTKLAICALLLAIFGSVLVSCGSSSQSSTIEISGITVKNEEVDPLSAENKKILEYLEADPTKYKTFADALVAEEGTILENAKNSLSEELKETLKTPDDVLAIVAKYNFNDIKDFVAKTQKCKEELDVLVKAVTEEKPLNLDEAKAIITKYDVNNTLTLEYLKAEDVQSIISNRTVTSEDLNKIATFLANNSAAHEGFVAAYRGYDVVGGKYDANEKFEGVKDENGKYIANVEAAKLVLKKYDTENTLKYDSINGDDIESIVLKLKEQTKIELDTNRGLFDNIQYWIGVALGWITKYLGFGNYIVGICIIAIVFEIILIPLSIKQQKNSIKMAKLRPKEMAIRKKYAGRTDQATQQKLQQEILDLQQRENVSPMSGCLPLLVQFPIIIVLYNVVIDPLRYVLGMAPQFTTALQKFVTTSKAAGGLGETLSAKNGTIEVLSVIKEKGSEALAGLERFLFFDNSADVYSQLSGVAEDSIPSFNIGAVNFGFTPAFTYENKWNYLLLLVPVITFLVYFFSMKISRKFTYQSTVQDQQQMGCSGKIMDISMPLMSTFFTFIVPGAVGVYWVFKSVVSTVKQFIVSRLMPLPVFTEEDYKAAEKEIGAKNSKKKAVEKDPNAPRVRSLHHIDDEDYEQPAPEPKKPAQKKETPIEKAPLKEDKSEDKKEEKEDNK